MQRPKLPVSIAITMGGVTVLLSIALLVGWTAVILQNRALTREVVQNTWLLVAGILSLVVIITVLVLLSVFVVRGTVESRRQDSFIDSVTHELKSPLASLKLCLETQARPDLTDSHRQQLRQMMLEDVERLSVFIDDVLEVSRVGSGRRGYAVATVVLRAVAERCAAAAVERYKVDPSCVVVDISPELQLTTDPTAIEMVMKNLIDNAVKYSDRHPKVVVRWIQQDKKHGVLEVWDEGIGIPRLHLKRVFERFYRVPTESVRARPGTGLGLYVAASLVRGLGGRLTAYSEGHGHGTSIRVRLHHDETRSTPTATASTSARSEPASASAPDLPSGDKPAG